MLRSSVHTRWWGSSAPESRLCEQPAQLAGWLAYLFLQSSNGLGQDQQLHGVAPDRERQDPSAITVEAERLCPLPLSLHHDTRVKQLHSKLNNTDTIGTVLLP